MREEIKKILWENLSVWNEGEIEESLDKITALIERESEYNELSRKLSELRDMMNISLNDLAQAVHSPEYFVDLLISYQEKERKSEQKYTRKQVQEACANAYQRGVDNRPYIEGLFKDWVEDEPNPPKSEEV